MLKYRCTLIYIFVIIANTATTQSSILFMIPDGAVNYDYCLERSLEYQLQAPQSLD